MKDRFEEFIQDHKSEFDIYEPSDELWKGIEKQIEPKKTLNWRFYLSRAAAVILIFGLSVLVQQAWLKKDTPRNDKTAEIEIDIPELREAELYYAGMVNTKLEEVKPMLSKYPSLEEELETDLTELDSIYNSLKIDLKDNVANNEVIEAMIENYRLRISILEDMLYFLESNNEDESNSNIEQI